MYTHISLLVKLIEINKYLDNDDNGDNDDEPMTLSESEVDERQRKGNGVFFWKQIISHKLRNRCWCNTFIYIK